MDQETGCVNPHLDAKRHNTKKELNRQQSESWKLTTLGFFRTISTAASSLSCSQRPSEAKMTNKSSGFNLRLNIEGSADITARFKGT